MSERFITANTTGNHGTDRLIAEEPAFWVRVITPERVAQDLADAFEHPNVHLAPRKPAVSWIGVSTSVMRDDAPVAHPEREVRQ